jgi:asparagine synthase (glutamine-hydrolysing)
MCGIAGIVNFDGKKVDKAELYQMMNAMKHRGPDDEGYFIDDTVGLAMVRLSIIDLSHAGHQPMFSSDGRYCIVFNGEVYNYIELRETLKEKYVFSSNTDTEVVLNSFIEWGDQCLDKFNGMFAFTIYDKATKSLFGARDRFGIKPFYYHKSSHQFIFASDIPPLLKIIPRKPTVNDAAVMNYLMLNRTNYSEETFFKEIIKIPPGAFFTLNNSVFKIKRWYDLHISSSGKSFKSPGEYYNSLKESVQLQLRSDVPVGICLSGGLDSSAIASIILKEYPHSEFHSYSAMYNPGDKGDEQEFIKEYEATLLKMHYTSPSHKGLLDDLDQYIEMLSEPVPGTSEYAEFKVMQLAKQHSTVILNGQGADEVLGGYEYFFGAYLKELLFKFKIPKLINEVNSLKKNHTLKKSLKYMIFFMTPSYLKMILLKDRRRLINKDFYKQHFSYSLKLIKQLYNFPTLKDYFFSHFAYKFEHHLLWADKSGMCFSVETRFPFLDHNLVESTIDCEPDMILKSGWTKHILREAMTGVLPEKIRTRKSKIGFETPEHDWIRQPHYVKFIKEIFQSVSFKNRKYFNQENIKTLYQKHLDETVNEANTIWKIIHLELWLRKYID